MGGSAVDTLPYAQGVILVSWDQIQHWATSLLMLGVDQQNVRGSRKVTWVSPFPALSPVDRIVFGQNSVLKLHVKTQWMDEWFNFVMNPM